jgi:tripartite-type tricarboxylate transporter receptor subunit TctC
MTAFFEKETGTQFALVPYRGEAPAIQDLVAGHIDICFGSPVQIATGAGRDHKSLCGDE